MQKCVKNHGTKITSYRFVRALHRPFGCVCMLIANRSEEKKLIAISCKQNVLVEVCSTLSHIISNVYLFFLQFKQKQLLMYVLLHIYQLLFNLLTLHIVDCDKF